MGRPKVSDEKRRSINFTIRISPEEQKKLDNASEVCGKSTAELVRSKLFKGKFPEAKMALTDADMYLELKKIGVNLNQLTRLANARILPNGLVKVLMQLREHQDLIIVKIFRHDSGSENR
jgi:hypothetical protein